MQRGYGGAAMGCEGGSWKHEGRNNSIGGQRVASNGGGVGVRGTVPRSEVQPAPRRVIEPINRTVTLNKAETAWKPTVAADKNNEDNVVNDSAQTQVSGVSSVRNMVCTVFCLVSSAYNCIYLFLLSVLQ